MSAVASPEIFKAYDIRGLYGEQIDGDLAERDRRAFAHVLAGLAGKPVERSARWARTRHAPERAGARGALSRGPAGGGRPRDRRRPGRQRDALLPRRLARARRRPDVHRLAQPQGLHGREARARRGDRAVGRLRHPGHSPRDRIARLAASAQLGGDATRRHGRGGRPVRGVPDRRAALHRRGRRALRVTAAEGRRRRRQRHGRPDGRPAAREPRARADRDLLDARRQLPRPRAQPAAAGEPAA